MNVFARFDVIPSMTLQDIKEIYNIMCLITIFLLGHDFRIFAKVADFEEKNFICQYIGIELPA